MHLLMFDVDGTLTNTTRIDHECYVRAVCETLRVESVDSDWAAYRHVTDSGIVAELLERARLPLALAINVKHRFVEMLQDAVMRGARICAIPGAGEVLATLARTDDVQPAIATGAWRDSAKFKLVAAGLDARGIPMATSDDSYCRTSIMRTAYARALRTAGVDTFETVTYVGDASWDLRAAGELGWAFLGRACGRRAERLRDLGAQHVLEDFSDADSFLAAWRECRADALIS